MNEIKLPPWPEDTYIDVACCFSSYCRVVSVAAAEAYTRAAIEADRKAPDDTVLTCDSCGVICQNPWHTSHGENRHVHLCDACYEADRKARGEPDGWQFFSPIDQEWHSTSDPDWHRKCGRALRAIYAAPQPQQIPEGYKLVPVEPTEEMINAANQGDRLYTDRCFGKDIPTVMQGPYDHYKAMLEASPEPKGIKGAKTYIELIREVRAELRDWLDEYGAKP